MKKYFIIIPFSLVSFTIVSCRANDDLENDIQKQEFITKSKIEIQNKTVEDSIVIQYNQTLDAEKKDPPVKDRQDWRSTP